ncbi:dienelactone hydrolase family-domain-containing protein [Zopfochytrium polystomum]|nr:dienelactone hydrolase family-domain-containing protein [Zopfochytrium polystomum]
MPAPARPAIVVIGTHSCRRAVHASASGRAAPLLPLLFPLRNRSAAARTTTTTTTAFPVAPRDRRALSTDASSYSFPVHRFDPHPTLDHPLHGSTAEDAPQPSVIVLQEWWGVDDQISSHAQRIANNTGAVAIVPDLYHGKQTLDEAEAAHMMTSLNWPKALTELEALALAEQTARGGPVARRKVGVVGFCMGGALSLALASRMAQRASPLNACISFYGIPPKSLVDVTSIPLTTPVQAHFGENDDLKGFSDAESAKELAKAWGLSVKQAGGIHAHGLHSLESNVFIHANVGHAFMNELKRRPYFNKDDADKTWSKVFAFLIEHLKSV